MTSERSDTYPFFLPPPTDFDTLCDYLTSPPASGAVLGSGILRKSIALNGLLVGNNQLVAIAGGLLRVDSWGFRVTTAATSGGAPTLDLNIQGGASLLTAPFAVADLALGAYLRGASGGGRSLATTVPGGSDPAIPALGGALIPTGTQINSQNGVDALRGVVAATIYTAGALELIYVYTPLTLGAALS